MKRYYPENRSYFTREEDAALFEYAEMGVTIAEQAELLQRRTLTASGRPATVMGIAT